MTIDDIALHSPWLHERKPSTVTPKGSLHTHGFPSASNVYSDRCLVLDAGGEVEWYFGVSSNYKNALSARAAVLDGHAGRCRLKVYGDGVIVADTGWIAAGERPRALYAELRGRVRITLTAEGDAPIIVQDALLAAPGRLASPLGTARAERCSNILLGGRVTPLCVATACDERYAASAVELVGSLWRNGDIDATALVFGHNLTPKTTKRLREAGAVVAPCFTDGAERDPTVFFSTTYLAAQFAEARHYLLLDADTRILSPLTPLTDTLEGLHGDTLLVARDPTIPANALLGNALSHPQAPFGGDGLGWEGDIAMLRLTPQEYNTQFVAAGGFLACSRGALLSFESVCRSLMPEAGRWLDRRPNAHRPEQALFALAVVKHGGWSESAAHVRAEAVTGSPRPCDGSGIKAASEEAILLHFGGEAGKSLLQSAAFSGVFTEEKPPVTARCERPAGGTTVEDKVKEFTLLHRTRTGLRPVGVTGYQEACAREILKATGTVGSGVVFATEGDGILAALTAEAAGKSSASLGSSKVYLIGKTRPAFDDLAPTYPWNRVTFWEGDAVTRLAKARKAIEEKNAPRFDTLIIEADAGEKALQTLASLATKVVKPDGALLVGFPDRPAVSPAAARAILSRSGWECERDGAAADGWQVWRQTGGA